MNTAYADRKNISGFTPLNATGTYFTVPTGTVIYTPGEGIILPAYSLDGKDVYLPSREPSRASHTYLAGPGHVIW
jgi:hypothetical protein